MSDDTRKTSVKENTLPDAAAAAGATAAFCPSAAGAADPPLRLNPWQGELRIHMYIGYQSNGNANAAAAVAAKIPLAEGTADPLPRLIPKYGFPQYGIIGNNSNLLADVAAAVAEAAADHLLEAAAATATYSALRLNPQQGCSYWFP